MSATARLRRWLARLTAARCGFCRRRLTTDNQFLDVHGRPWAVCSDCIGEVPPTP